MGSGPRPDVRDRICGFTVPLRAWRGRPARVGAAVSPGADVPRAHALQWRIPADGRTRAASSAGYSVARIEIPIPASAAAATDSGSTWIGSRSM